MTSPGGEIGRRMRLKISRLWRAGSIPARGTIYATSAQRAKLRLNLIIALDRLEFNHIRLNRSASTIAKYWDASTFDEFADNVSREEFNG